MDHHLKNQEFIYTQTNDTQKNKISKSTFKCANICPSLLKQRIESKESISWTNKVCSTFFQQKHLERRRQKDNTPMKRKS